MILHYFRKKENNEQQIAKNIYNKILKLSNLFLNENNFFKNNDYNSSFEIVSILIIIYIKINIKFKIKNYKIINEQLMNLLVSDLDESLRSKGIGDMSIGKYVKSYVKKFYFRLSKFPGDITVINQDSLLLYFNYFDFLYEDEKLNASIKLYNIYKNIINNYK